MIVTWKSGVTPVLLARTTRSTRWRRRAADRRRTRRPERADHQGREAEVPVLRSCNASCCAIARRGPGRLRALEQGNGMGRQPLAPPREAEPVGRRRANVDLALTDRRAEPAPHLVAMGRDPRLFPTSTQSAFTSRQPAAVTCAYASSSSASDEIPGGARHPTGTAHRYRQGPRPRARRRSERVRSRRRRNARPARAGSPARHRPARGHASASA